MRLHLTDGTTVTVDDGDFIITEDDADCFFMSEGQPVVILNRYVVRLVDASGEPVAEWA